MTIPEVWRMLGLPGQPKRSCRSPFREDRTPSFSIHDDGRAWHDHATGDGGDVIAFIRQAIGGDYREVRLWLAERNPAAACPRPARKAQAVKATTPEEPRRIQWPAELREGDSAVWSAFAGRRGLTFPAVHALVGSGILRFCTVEGTECFAITDGSGRAAEIRRLDGRPFGKTKAYPLRGVDKSWLPGIELLKGAPHGTGVLITEGATDLLAAVDFYSRYHRQIGGRHSWVPAALLGAACRSLHPEAVNLIRGRRVRIVPDADAAGDAMADHWTALLQRLGCTVDIVNLERGTDLSANLTKLSPTHLFHK